MQNGGRVSGLRTEMPMKLHGKLPAALAGRRKMKRRNLLRWFGAAVLGSTMIAQGYCLPANYFADSGRNIAVALANGLVAQYIFLPIADGLGLDVNTNGNSNNNANDNASGDTTTP